MADLILRADAIEAVAKLQKYDLDERNRLRIYAPWHGAKRIFVETEAIYKTIHTLPSAETTGALDDAIAQYVADGLMELPSAEAVKVAYICDGRKCDSDCSDCFRTLDIEHAKDFKLMGDTYFQQPSAEAVQGWIPCSERLPDIKEHHVSDPCLVYCENGVYGFAELEENIFGQVGWDCEREDEYHEPIGEVTAWMPLPKPYREDGEA